MKIGNPLSKPNKILFLAGILGMACLSLYMFTNRRAADVALQPVAETRQTTAHNAGGDHAHDTCAHAPAEPSAIQLRRESPPLAEHRNAPNPEPVIRPLKTVLRNVTTLPDDWREFKPASITIAPIPELEASFEMSSVRTEHDRTIWTGRNPGLPGAFLVTVATKENLHAIVSYGMPSGGSFSIRAEGDVAEVTEQPADFTCGTPDAVAAADKVGAAANGELTPGIDKATAQAAGTLQVDVLFFYDKAMLTTYSKEDIKSRMINLLEAGNIILAQSLVDDFRWHFVECYEVPEYGNCSGLGDDLGLMANPYSPLGEYVEMRRARHHADQMQLWVRYGHNDGVAGVATIGGYHSVVVADTGYQTVVHELGHNFGCRHDRDETTSGASDDDGKYNYAWSDKGEAKYNEDNPDETPKPYYYGTIMSYAKTDRFDYFSNPYVYHSYYDVLGRPKTSPMGYYAAPGGGYHPRAAFNALQLSRLSLWMSTVGDPPSPPKILAQPQSVAMGVGSVATLQVYASSPPKAGTVRYQWRKGMTALSGATQDRLVVSANSTNDSGIYYVEVSNEAGSVTSNPATVTITSVPGEPTYTSTEGGGALSLWYFSAIVFLIARRICGGRESRAV